MLVACGLALEAVNREGATPLFVAAQHGDTGMTRVLLSHGADFTFARPHVRSHPLLNADVRTALDTVMAVQQKQESDHCV